MILTIFWSLVSLANASSQEAPPSIAYLQETKNLIALLKSEQIYFIGSSADSIKWSGEIFWYGNGACFKSDEKSEMSGRVDIKPTSCSSNIKLRAQLKYANVKTSQELKEKLISCLKSQNISCLRSLTDKNIQISFGVEPPGDQAFQMYSRWKKTDYKKMKSLLEQGLNCTSEDHCEFPKLVSDNGTGLRGGFEKSDGRWLLKYYLAGD